MTKSITGNQGPTIGLSTSLDLYQKLQFESERLITNHWHSYDAFNFIITAWHLYDDWLQKGNSKTLSVQKRRKEKCTPKSMHLVLQLVNDLANGSKHFQLNQPAARNRKINETHEGNESSFYSWFNRERGIPGLTADDGSYFSLRQLNLILMRYFEWVFDDSVGIDTFPKDIEYAIEYCNIANRAGKDYPSLFLSE